MRKILLSIAAAALAAASLTALSPASAHQHDGRVVKLTTKTLAETPHDGPPKLGDVSVITEDAYRDGKKVGTSDLTCTMVRLDLAKHFFAAECFNTTVLPEGQITTQGYVTSDQIEQVPFEQAITGGTGAYRSARGVLTVDEAGDGPAHLTFRLG